MNINFDQELLFVVAAVRARVESLKYGRPHDEDEPDGGYCDGQYDAFESGRLSAIEWLRHPEGSGTAYRMPSLLADIPELAVAFRDGEDEILDMQGRLVLRDEVITVPTATGHGTARFLVTRTADEWLQYRAHWGFTTGQWGFTKEPSPFGEAFFTYREADAALEACRKAFLEAVDVGGVSLHGITVPKFEVLPKVWPATGRLEAESA